MSVKRQMKQLFMHIESNTAATNHTIQKSIKFIRGYLPPRKLYTVVGKIAFLS